MVRTCLLTAIALSTLASAAPAQAPAWRFRWQPGQVLVYKVQQVTSALDVAGETKVQTTTSLQNTKQWQVLDVDAQGVATLQLSLRSLRLETTTPKGETLLFDSTNPQQSNPQMREQLAQYVGQPLAVVRVDGRGQVIEVRESKFGPASRFESEPPFALVLPETAPAPGHSWERTYKLTLEPPQGTGEKYDAAQRYVCKAADAATATVTLSTLLKTMPESALDRIPLLQMQPEGEVVFDVQAGILRSVRLRVEKELTGHQGEGSSYRFVSSYTEDFLGGK